MFILYSDTTEIREILYRIILSVRPFCYINKLAITCPALDRCWWTVPPSQWTKAKLIYWDELSHWVNIWEKYAYSPKQNRILQNLWWPQKMCICPCDQWMGAATCGLITAQNSVITSQPHYKNQWTTFTMVQKNRVLWNLTLGRWTGTTTRLDNNLSHWFTSC